MQRINKRPATDHVTSGSIRDLKKTASDGTDKQTDKWTWQLNWPSGADAVTVFSCVKVLFKCPKELGLLCSLLSRQGGRYRKKYKVKLDDDLDDISVIDIIVAECIRVKWITFIVKSFTKSSI